MSITFSQHEHQFVGPGGTLEVPSDDPISHRFAMLLAGECGGLGATRAARLFGFSRQRYYQLLELLREQGPGALAPLRRGPKTHHRRTDQVTQLVIRWRFLDPDASPDVITQKLRQDGHRISVRSVHRIIADYGLQKKTLRP